MREMTMLSVVAISAFAVSSTALAASGSRLPTFDIARNCKAESAGATVVGQSVDMCSRDGRSRQAVEAVVALQWRFQTDL